MLKGIISMTGDSQTINTAIQNGYTVVCMKESIEPNEYLGPNVIYASILLPPFEAVSAYLDTEDLLAKQIYFDYLSTREPDMYICALLAASLKGINIVIYIDKDMYEIGFAGMFHEFLLMTYGVNINSCETQNFGFIPTAIGVILSKLYLYDFMDFDSFFMMYPQGMPLEKFILPRLLADFNPFTVPATELDYYNFFMNYKENIKLYGNKPLIIPFVTDGRHNGVNKIERPV